MQSSELAIANQEQGLDPDFDFEKLLRKLRGLQELANQNWWLSSSQLVNVLELESLPPGDEFEHYGFRFSRVGEHGSESAWKVEKL